MSDRDRVRPRAVAAGEPAPDRLGGAPEQQEQTATDGGTAVAGTDAPVGRRGREPGDAPRPADGSPAALTPPAETGASPAGVAAGGEPVATTETGWRRGLAESLAFLRRRMTGEYEVDDFGYDADFTDHVVVPPLKLLYDKWFRIETVGLENIPDAGGALLVANHSGTIAVDALMTAVAVREHHPMHRPLRMLGADLVFQTPFMGPIARKMGNTLACNPDAERLLSTGELVAVFPEGFKGVGKPYSQRYRLQRFGRGGFVTAAMKTGVPIIPVSIVGAEEIYPLIGNLKPLARALGFPYFPVTPTFPLLGPLGAVPLPSKWIIEFGEPIPTTGFGDNAADDPMVVFNITDRVRETIQQTLYRLLLRRGHPFLG
ncbi:1-acyl-sn-glycerol-3-phosphate acyltransferase [Nakamurella sp.]|uniref:lysophospholipid acyltransferase family protein n=1 Tax=Nakamurella sp. TaxID=1869182 RepID=UPI003B3A0B3E